MKWNHQFKSGVIFGVALLFSTANAYGFNIASQVEATWSTDEILIDYNQTDCSDGVDFANDLEAAINLSWNSVAPSRFRLRVGEATSSTDLITGKIIILCTSLGAGIGGVADFGFIDGDIVQARIQINTDIDFASVGKEVLALIIAHELGHTIGIAHSDDAEALMFFSGPREKMSQDDVSAVSYLYPRNDISDGPFGCGSISVGGPFDNNGGLLSISLLLLVVAFASRITRMRSYQWETTQIPINM